MKTSVTVISCLYGRTHDRFLWEWLSAVRQLDPAPAEVIIATDRYRHITDGALEVFRRHNDGTRYPQAFYLNKALEQVETEWVWIHDIDDLAFPDALEGLDDVDADVFQMGYLRSDGLVYLPPELAAAEVLASPRNPFVAGSCVRTEALRAVGGFPDIAFQDWGLWLQLARAGATFAASDRPRFHYRRHGSTRGACELTLAERAAHTAEMESLALTV